VVHGTTSKAWPLILSTGGLKKMTRNHVHFASGLPAGFKSLEEAGDSGSEIKKEPVISGMRNSSSILIYIDIKKALEGGLKFWRSANGVILSDGNEKGIIPVEYFKCVEERKKGMGVIMIDGKITKEMAQ
jgi:2'-phosphotransferase